MPAAHLNIRLQPRARRDALLDERDGVLRVSVVAPPVDDRANDALCRLIARRVEVAPSRVTVIRGRRSREKVVRVDGIEQQELRRLLGLSAS